MTLMRVVDNLQQSGKIHKLQQVCGVSGCLLVEAEPYLSITDVFHGTTSNHFKFVETPPKCMT